MTVGNVNVQARAKTAMKWAGFAFVIGSFALGCSNSGSKNDSPAPDTTTTEASQASELQGRWLSTCGDATMFGMTQQSDLSIAGLNATQLTRVSSEGECSKPAVEVRQVARIDKGDEVTAGVRKVDIGVNQVFVKPVSEIGVQILNLANFCAISDWALNVEREVTANTGTQSCFERVPATLFEIYLVEDSKLYFGNGDPGTSDATRPVEVDRQNPFTRQ